MWRDLASSDPCLPSCYSSVENSMSLTLLLEKYFLEI